jgi:hypothetical protein
VGHYTRKVIAETVEPAVKAALDGYGLAGFKFEKVTISQNFWSKFYYHALQHLRCKD